jgi:aryl-alcohol dehydrogenase-like predicted oxidoreductase
VGEGARAGVSALGTRMTAIGPIRWRGEEVSRLVLGTAQLGMAYGIANVSGQPSADLAREIVRRAWEGGVRFFDTAQGYGRSEKVLGAALAGLGLAEEARVVTKLSPELDRCDARGIREAVEASVRRLGGRPLWGLMLHREGWLDVWDGPLGHTMRALRDGGLVKYLGASVYSAARAKEALSHEDIDILQIPASAWDGRMEDAGVFRLAGANDRLCFVRSIYLQGLLALAPRDVETRLPPAGPVARRWHGLAESLGVSVRLLAMRLALAMGAPLVVGAETIEQIGENLAMLAEGPLEADQIRRVREALGPVPEELVNPSLWPRRP